MPTIGPLEIVVILIACMVPLVLIGGVVAFIVWAIRWNRGKQTIVIPKDKDDGAHRAS